MKPLRAASLASAGMASSRLPRMTSTFGISLADLGAHLLQMRRHEMDHPLDAHRQFAIGRRGADGEGFEEFARALAHEQAPLAALPLG